MATRLYLHTASHGSKTTTSQSTIWTNTTYANRNHVAKTTRAGGETSTDYGTVADTDKTAQGLLFYQAISEQPLATDTIDTASAVKCYARGRENNTSNNLYFRWAVWLMNADGSAYSNIVYGTSGTEYTTSNVNRGVSANTASQLTGCAGKYIVVDLGVYGDPANQGTGHQGYVVAGNPSSTNDLPENQTDTNDYNPWLEFAQTLTFDDGVADGALSVTDADDTFSADGSVPVAAAFSVTDAADTFASDGSLLVQAASSLTDEADGFVSAGAVSDAGRTGDCALTDDADSFTSDGSVQIQGACSVTDEADALVTAGVVDVAGDSTLTDTADGFTADGAVDVVAASSLTDEADGFLSEGTVTAQGAVGDCALTDDADTFASAGVVEVAGAASLTDAADGFSSAGSVDVAGASSLTDAADAISSDGGVTAAGASSLTDDVDTMLSAGVVGDAARTAECSLTDEADGFASAGVVDVQGASSLTDTSDGLSSAGAVDVVGAADLVDASDTLSSQGSASDTRFDCQLVDAADTLASAGYVDVVGECDLLDEDDTMAVYQVSKVWGDAPPNRRRKQVKGPVYRKTIETFQAAKLRSGKVDGPLVVDPRQARAIAYNIEEKANLKKRDDDELDNPFNRQV